MSGFKLGDGVKKAWVQALRSGEYKQFIGGWSSLDNKRHCCLDVLSCLAGNDRDQVIDLFDKAGASYIKMLLVRMNDQQGKSFDEIADYIEANL